MGAWLLVQYVVIALAVVASVAVVMGKGFPSAARGLRMAVGVRLLGQGARPWMQSLGRRIAPAPRSAPANCVGCDSCD